MASKEAEARTWRAELQQHAGKLAEPSSSKSKGKVPKRLSVEHVKAYLPKGAPATVWHDVSANRIRGFVTIAGSRKSLSCSLERFSMHDACMQVLRWAWKVTIQHCGEEPCSWPELLE